MKVQREITQEYILSKISAYDIFRMYYPGKLVLNKMCLSPFVKEKHPSCIIGNKFGEITYKCFNSSHRGDCFAFVMQLYSLSYGEALEKIALDFGLKEGSAVITSELITYEQPEIIVAPTLLQAENRPFTDEDRAYLKAYHLTPRDLSFCKDTRAYSTLKWFMNRSRVRMSSKEVCFFYYLRNERGNWIKVYRPNAPKELKWRSSIPFTEMHGVGNISPGCKIGLITKSIKDGAFIAKYILPCVEIVQAEDITAITPENMRRIKESCETLYIAFDCDKKGKEASIQLTQELDCKHINPPDRLLDFKESDFSGMGKAWGVASVIEHFKQKGVI